MGAELDTLRWQKQTLVDDIARLETRYKQALAFLERIGVVAPPKWFDDIPF